MLRSIAQQRDLAYRVRPALGTSFLYELAYAVNNVLVNEMKEQVQRRMHV